MSNGWISAGRSPCARHSCSQGIAGYISSVRIATAASSWPSSSHVVAVAAALDASVKLAEEARQRGGGCATVHVGRFVLEFGEPGLACLREPQREANGIGETDVGLASCRAPASLRAHPWKCVRKRNTNDDESASFGRALLDLFHREDGPSVAANCGATPRRLWARRDGMHMPRARTRCRRRRRLQQRWRQQVARRRYNTVVDSSSSLASQDWRACENLSGRRTASVKLMWGWPAAEHPLRSEHIRGRGSRSSQSRYRRAPIALRSFSDIEAHQPRLHLLRAQGAGAAPFW